MIKSVSALKNVWKIPDLQKKILYTMMILVVYRIGAHIPTPFIDRAELKRFMDKSTGGGLFAVVDMFSGGAFRQMSIFALGIMPYISMSIILQLLAIVYPKLQKIQQEGALGQKKINKYTRFGTIGLAAFQGLGLGYHMLQNHLTYFAGSHNFLFLTTTVVAMMTGTAFIMWLGERITDKGIGNGISMIIAVGIMAHYPQDATVIWDSVAKQTIPALWIPVILALFVASTFAIILVQEGSRRIPMQHAKRVVGRRIMSGGTNYLPLKVNTAGVIPVIFASAILSFPGFLASFISHNPSGGALGNFFRLDSRYNFYTAIQHFWPAFNAGGIFNLLKSINPHIFLFAVLTGFFCYFYTAIAFNPDDVANNLKKSGSFIPGKRPGKPTSDHIEYVLIRITTVGMLFLVAIAVVPLVMVQSFGMPYTGTSFVGGTGLIIVIGVLLDTLKQIESQLLMRHYEGFAMRRTSSAAKWR